MDTYFYNSLGSYDFDVRCEMLKELGYDATYLTLWNEPAWEDVPKLSAVKSRHGLDVAGVYVTLDIAGARDHEGNRRILHLVETLEGCGNVEASVTSSDTTMRRSDPVGDEAALRLLEMMMGPAERNGLTVLLYPHVNFWLERTGDALRLCRKLDHPSLRMVFPGFHWYAVDGADLSARLQEAAPFLGSVNICGSRRSDRDGKLPATIEPLDEGELDNFALLGLLRRIGYAGMLGLQGYSVGGDVYAKLRRSIEALRDIERRLEAHPRWAELRAAPLPQ